MAQPQQPRQPRQSLTDLAYRTAAGILGGPVDIATMVMRPLGYRVPEQQVVGGSEWMGRQMERAGLISSARAPVQEFITSLLVPTPSGAGTAISKAIFIGAAAKTWDAAAAAKAKELEKAGVDTRSIWQQTGTWKGPDGKWRQEISDDAARMKGLDGTNKQVSMVNLLDHPVLYDAYPAKQYYQAEVTSATTLPPHLRQHLVGKGEGSFTPGGPSGEPFIQTTAYTPRDTSITLHELQHAVQDREGFAKGGNSMMAFLPQNKEAFALLAQKRREMQTPLSLDDYTKQAWGMDAPTDEVRKAYADYVKTTKQVSPAADRAAQEWAGKEYYRRLAGEAEARAVQSRMNLTPAQRRATFPPESYDVPIEQLIIRGIE